MKEIRIRFNAVNGAAKREDGYTIIEMMVALIILFMVLIPVTQLMGFLISDSHNIDKINAVMLAEKEMELCISTSSYEDDQWIESIDGREYQVNKRTERRDKLITITVEVIRYGRSNPLVKLQTSRLYDE